MGSLDCTLLEGNMNRTYIRAGMQHAKIDDLYGKSFSGGQKICKNINSNKKYKYNKNKYIYTLIYPNTQNHRDPKTKMFKYWFFVQSHIA